MAALAREMCVDDSGEKINYYICWENGKSETVTEYKIYEKFVADYPGDCVGRTGYKSKYP